MDNIYQNYDIPVFKIIPAPVNLNKNIYPDVNKENIDIRDIYEKETFTTNQNKIFILFITFLFTLFLYTIFLFTKS
jgi:hypothetical protein